MQYTKLNSEILYIKDVFQAVYGHFLSAIDHLECHLKLMNTTEYPHHSK